jgi:hypothetical protein
MTYMLCRNRVADFPRWKAVFASHAEAHRKAGLSLAKLWRAVAEPNNIFFLFEVASIHKALEFLEDPVSAEAGEAAGVVDGEFHFIEEAGGY